MTLIWALGIRIVSLKQLIKVKNLQIESMMKKNVMRLKSSLHLVNNTTVTMMKVGRYLSIAEYI